MKYINKLITFRQSPFAKFLLIVCCVLSFIIFLKPLMSNYYPDFSSYYYGARTVLHGGNPYLGGKNFFGSFLYPPFALLVFLPFTFISFFIAEKVFVVLSLLCLFLAIILLFKLFKISVLSTVSLFLLTLVFNFFPEKFTLGMGQINNVVLLLMSLFVYFYIKKREYLAGIVLALAIMLKLSPVILIFFLLIDKRWKLLIATCVALAIMILSIAIFINPANNIYFLKTALPELLASWKGDYYNQALSGFLQRAVPNIFIRQFSRIFLGILLLLTSLFSIWKYHSKNDNSRLLSLSILMTISLIINSFSWQHHFVWLLIPYLITLMQVKKTHLSIRFYLLLSISFFLVAINVKNPATIPTILQSHVLYGTLLLYGLEIYLLILSAKPSTRKVAEVEK
ncbi:MAG TPA: glycosyltransferase family 87 protein [Candidatus Saccharimonadales bacterium]|nr:glycosyltransferase family 87 protein [Candidatus Saccharimonadales bacterium]